jgi:hypothetical protein
VDTRKVDKLLLRVGKTHALAISLSKSRRLPVTCRVPISRRAATSAVANERFCTLEAFVHA